MKKTALVCMFVCVSVFSYVKDVSAIPFGGRILAIVPCTCTLGFAVLVGLPRPRFFLFQPGISQLHATFTPLPGSNTAGNYIPGGVCLTALACVPIPVVGTIFKIGTSIR